MPLPDYSGMNTVYFKTEHYFPAQQPRKLAVAQRRIMMTPPSNNPSRSQFSQGYTDPIQMFAASNSWQSPSGQKATATRKMSQPSLQFAGPGNMTIPTAMPFQK